MIKYLGKLFLTGIVFLLPLVSTTIVVIWLVSFLSNYVGPNTFVGFWLDKLGLTFIDDETFSYMVGWLIVIGAMILLGFIIETTAKRWIVDTTDGIMKRIPLIGNIYSPIRQITNLIQTNKNEQLQNMSPVYCRFGNSLFLALMPVCDEFEVQGKRFREVVIPTAPIPFGGAVILVPVEDVFDAKMSVEQLLTYYVSMGVTAKDCIPTIDVQTGQLVIPTLKKNSSHSNSGCESSSVSKSNGSTETPTDAQTVIATSTNAAQNQKGKAASNNSAKATQKSGTSKNAKKSKARK